MSPDVGNLEEERDFLLRSLEDLEAEHQAGDLDDGDYVTLKDDYTARAARVLRALNGSLTADDPTTAEGARPAEVAGSLDVAGSAGTADSPLAGDSGAVVEGEGWQPASSEGDSAEPASSEVDSAEPTSDQVVGALRAPGFVGRHRKAVLTVCALLIVGAGVGYAVTASSSQRVAGETITGENVGSSQIDQLLIDARNAEVKGDAVTELKDTREILAKDPSQPEALTLEGWLLAQTQQPKLVAQGIGLLKVATEVDPTFVDAHAYLAIALLSEKQDRQAIPQLKWYLAHHPTAKLAPKFRAALVKAEAAVN